MVDTTPKSLLSRVSLGDRSAFNALYDSTSGKLYSVAITILKNHAEAQEALQDCYMNVWRRAASYDPDRASAMSWLIAVARNAAIDRLRRRRDHSNIDDVPEPEDEFAISPEAAAGASQEAERLHDCLGELSDREAELIRSAFMSGASYSEIAQQKAKPLGTIKSTIRRAMMKLRHCLER